MAAAELFIHRYNGSYIHGDHSNGVLFVIDGRTITLEYSRDKFTGNSQRLEREPRIVKSDWICGNCNGQNFAKRNECYRCSQPKSENSLLVNPSGEPLVDTIMTTDTPGTFLVAQGFNPLMTEDDIANIFRQFAVVKSCVLVMDYSKQISRGIAYIEFHTVEYAAFCIDGVRKVGLKVEEGREIKLNYANIVYMNKLLTVQQQQYQHLMNPMAIAAMQAAQWSSSNTFLQQQQQQEAYNTALYNATMKPKSVWPPVFETNGGAYVFQAQSGSFFEQISGFYYFPKTKLYYNSSTAEYFVHSPTSDPPFSKYDAAAAAGTTSTINSESPALNQDDSSSTTAASSNVNVAELMKKPVIISLGAASKKTNAVTNKKVLVNQWGGGDDDDEDDDKKNVSNKPLPPVVKSKYAKAGPLINTPDAATAAHLSKYGPPVLADTSSGTTRSRSDSNVDSNPVEAPANIQAGSSAAVAVVAVAAVSTNGKFICHLCKRQFNSAQHLAQHEQGSQLHKDNLLKKQAEESGPVYRDRAAERRNNFGSSDPAVSLRYYNGNNDDAVSGGDKKRRKEDHIPTAVAAPVSLTEDSSNMGNQLLRKMGWNDGKGLGKEENGMSETVAEKMSQNSRSSSSKTVGIGTSVGPAIDYEGSEEQYSQSLRIAAKFRYDQINDKK